MVMVQQFVRRPGSASWGAMAVLTAVVFAASAGLQQAAETAPPPPTRKLTPRDIQLSVHARKALAEDKDLAAANLGVRVQDNVAVLWGPAPSEELKRRAVEVVKKVKGIFEVKDADVYIVPRTAAETPAPAAAAPPDEATHTEAASPPEPVVAPSAAPSTALTGRPPIDLAPPPEVVLKPPLPVGDAGPARTVSAAPPAEGLAAALEQVRQGEERFRQVDCRLAGDVVIIRPGAAHGEDAMAFARAISHLPGLARIVIEGEGDAPR